MSSNSFKPPRQKIIRSQASKRARSLPIIDLTLSSDEDEWDDEVSALADLPKPLPPVALPSLSSSSSSSSSLVREPPSAVTPPSLPSFLPVSSASFSSSILAPTSSFSFNLSHGVDSSGVDPSPFSLSSLSQRSKRKAPLSVETKEKKARKSKGRTTNESNEDKDQQSDDDDKEDKEEAEKKESKRDLKRGTRRKQKKKQTKKEEEEEEDEESIVVDKKEKKAELDLAYGTSLKAVPIVSLSNPLESAKLKREAKTILIRREQAVNELFNILATKWTQKYMIDFIRRNDWLWRAFDNDSEAKLRKLGTHNLRLKLADILRSHSWLLDQALEAENLFKMTPLEARIFQQVYEWKSVAPSYTPSYAELVRLDAVESEKGDRDQKAKELSKRQSKRQDDEDHHEGKDEREEEENSSSFTIDKRVAQPFERLRMQKRSDNAEFGFIQKFFTMGDPLKLIVDLGSLPPTRPEDFFSIPLPLVFAQLFHVIKHRGLAKYDLAAINPDWENLTNKFIDEVEYETKKDNASRDRLWEKSFLDLYAFLLPKETPSSRGSLELLSSILGYGWRQEWQVRFVALEGDELQVIVQKENAPWLPNPDDRRLRFRWNPGARNFYLDMDPGVLDRVSASHPLFLIFGRTQRLELQLTFSDELKDRLFNLLQEKNTISVIKRTVKFNPGKGKLIPLKQEKITARIVALDPKTREIQVSFVESVGYATSSAVRLQRFTSNSSLTRKLTFSLPQNPSHGQFLPLPNEIKFNLSDGSRDTHKTSLARIKNTPRTHGHLRANSVEYVAYELVIIPYWDDQLAALQDSIDNLLPFDVLNLLAQFLI